MFKRFCAVFCSIVCFSTGGVGAGQSTLPDESMLENVTALWWSSIPPAWGGGLIVESDNVVTPWALGTHIFEVLYSEGTISDRLPTNQADLSIVFAWVRQQRVVWGARLGGASPCYVVGPASRYAAWADQVQGGDRLTAAVTIDVAAEDQIHRWVWGSAGMPALALRLKSSDVAETDYPTLTHEETYLTLPLPEYCAEAPFQWVHHPDGTVRMIVHDGSTMYSSPGPKDASSGTDVAWTAAVVVGGCLGLGHVMAALRG